MTLLDRTKSPEIKEFGELSMPQIESMMLDNGILLHVMDHGHQEVSCITCVWNGGIAEAASNTMPGLALTLMREGTSGHTDGQLADMLEFNGARLFTSVDSHFSVLKLYTLNSKLDNVLPLLPEMMLEPVFPEKNFNVLREKSAKNIEIASRKVEFQASRLVNDMVMGSTHPLAVNDTPDMVRNISIDDIRSWHAATFRPMSDGGGASNLSVYVAGRIAPSTISLVNRLFGTLDVTGCVLPQFNIRRFDCSHGGERSVTVEGALQSAVRMFIPTVGREHSDYIALRLLIIALGGYFGSRLMANIREDKGYTYGINSYLLGYPEGGIIGISTSTDNAYVEPLIAETRSELARLAAGDFSPEEMTRLKQYAMSTLASSLDSPFDIMDYYINRKVSFIPAGYFERQVEEIRALTPERLAEVARRHIDLDLLNIAVAGA